MFNYGKDYLTAGKALQILRGQLPAQIDASTRRRIEENHRAVLDIARGDQVVYGINTGFGPLCNTIVDKKHTSELQRNLLLSHSVGVGGPIDREASKLMLILKLHALAMGFSGIALPILERIRWHIEEDLIPVVPKQGSVGASGDLAPLAHLFLPLLGEGQLYYRGKIRPTGEVFQKLGIAPVSMHPKAGLALINGTQFMGAHAVKLVEALYRHLAHADLIAALMIEGMLGSAMPFHPELHRSRPHPGVVHVAGRLHAFLQGSEIVASHQECDRVQDPYSLRCVPQVHGSSRSAWLHLKQAVETELNSVTDNPVILSSELTISGGSFHGQPLALPMDYACLAAAEIGSISDRRSYYALEGKVAGVPKLLFEKTGLHSGFMILQYTSAALVSENKGLCFPASADSIPTSLGQEDHVSMGSIGGRKALRVCQNLHKILAVELLCAAQAFEYHRPLRSGAVPEAAFALVRERIPFATEDRIFSQDIHRADRLLGNGDLLEIMNHFKTSAYSRHDDLFENY